MMPENIEGLGITELVGYLETTLGEYNQCCENITRLVAEMDGEKQKKLTASTEVGTLKKEMLKRLESYDLPADDPKVPEPVAAAKEGS